MTVCPSLARSLPPSLSPSDPPAPADKVIESILLDCSQRTMKPKHRFCFPKTLTKNTKKLKGFELLVRDFAPAQSHREVTGKSSGSHRQIRLTRTPMTIKPMANPFFTPWGNSPGSHRQAGPETPPAEPKTPPGPASGLGFWCFWLGFLVTPNRCLGSGSIGGALGEVKVNLATVSTRLKAVGLTERLLSGVLTPHSSELTALLLP